jgi:antitoxin component of MazEF toxin-antitoxin module
MVAADSPLAGAPYASRSVENTVPPGQVLPPPVPGGTTVYYWADENGKYPWSFGGYAGARPALPLVAGGVVVVPEPDLGVMRILTWWPNVPILHIVRTHPDGTRYPVRGGYGLIVNGVSRTNYATNPSFEVGLNGLVPDVGSPTLTRITAPTDVPTIPRGQWAMRATNASAGSSGVTIPTSLLGATPITIGLDVQFSVRPTLFRIAVSWADSGGGALATTTKTFTANEVNESVSQWARQVGAITPPVGAVTPTIKVIADGMTAGATMDLDGFTIERAATDGSYFDGDDLGGSWAGTAELSASTLAPVQTVLDGEAPLDIPVTYTVADPSLTGGRVTSGLATLDSRGRFSWLTHPRRPGQPVRVDLEVVPILERGIDQGIFWPIGARRAIVISSAQRRAPTAELIFNAVSFAQRDTLVALFADAMPILLRAPARYAYGEGTWWSLGTVVEDRRGRLAYQDAMVLTSTCVEVNAPPPDVVALV